jgi:hypothetical protein
VLGYSSAEKKRVLAGAARAQQRREGQAFTANLSLTAEADRVLTRAHVPIEMEQRPGLRNK